MRHNVPMAMGIALFALIALAAMRAEAATQILGLVASNGLPTPLLCRDGTCEGVFNGFCLQQDRPAPTLGSQYELAPGGGITLIAKRADRSTFRLAGEGLVSISVDTGFTSVTISVPEAILQARGAVSAAIQIAPLTSILPATLADDPDPQNPDDVAEAIGPVRRVAAGIFERSGEESDAARLVALAINALPPDRDWAPADLHDIFRRAIAGASAGGISAEGLAAAERIADECQSYSSASPALRFCLEVKRNTLLGELNQELWKATGGS